MPIADPFLIPPELWFGVLCEEVSTDQAGRFNFGRVFNTLFLQTPPPASGLKPFAHLQAILAVGFSHGVGEFTASVELQNVDGKALARRPEPWVFQVGPGDAQAATLADVADHWFTAPGNYYYVIRLAPGDIEHRIRFEVAMPPVVAGRSSPQS